MAAHSSAAVLAAGTNKGELAGLDDQALLGLVRSLPKASQRRAAACELLVTRHQGLVLCAPLPGQPRADPGPDEGGARWPIRVERPVQGLVLRAPDATGPLAQQLGRTPADSELAGQDATITLAGVVGEEDPRLEHMLSMRAVNLWTGRPLRQFR